MRQKRDSKAIFGRNMPVISWKKGLERSERKIEKTVFCRKKEKKSTSYKRMKWSFCEHSDEECGINLCKGRTFTKRLRNSVRGSKKVQKKLQKKWKKVLTMFEVRGIIAKRSEGQPLREAKRERGTASDRILKTIQNWRKNDSQFNLSFTWGCSKGYDQVSIRKDTRIKLKSLILAQDERWRRA